MLVDIVSRNGNLLLNIPVREDGTIGDKEVAILEGIAAWDEYEQQEYTGQQRKIFVDTIFG